MLSIISPPNLDIYMKLQYKKVSTLNNLLNTIDHLPISHLILKLYAFDIFFICVISLTEDKMVHVPCKSNGKDK